MPIATTHPQYNKRKAAWKRCRVVVEGEDAVKGEGETYLPKLGKQSSRDYEAYKARAEFFAGTARTLDAMMGMIFRIPPSIQFPEPRKSMLNRVTETGQSLESVIRHSVRELWITGRLGVLVDFPGNPASPTARPNVITYSAEDIINWRMELVGDERVLSSVVVTEHRAKPNDDPFSHDTELVYRHLFLQKQEDGSVVYASEVFTKAPAVQTASGGGYVSEGIKVPTIRGQPLVQLPFFFMGPSELSCEVQKPPLLDLANVNLSHYRTSADLEHGRHFTALPTAWAAGFPPKSELSLGSQEAWVSEEPNARCGFLEFSGAGLSALENALSQKQKEMAILGARLLEEDKLAAEAEGTHRMRRSSEAFALSAMVSNVSLGFTQMLRLWTFWAGLVVPDELVLVELNTDFIDAPIDTSLLNTLMAAVQNGHVSWDTFFYNAKQGELFPRERTADQERMLIQMGGPIPMSSVINPDGSVAITIPGAGPSAASELALAASQGQGGEEPPPEGA